MGASASTPRAFPHHDSTADDVLAAFPGAAQGKRVLVTGARPGGLGFEAARALAAGGASVVLACRSQASCDEALAALAASAGPEAAARASTLVLDLASLASCAAAGAVFLARDQPLHVLLNSAGVMACPPGTTADGVETQLGTNHVGHAALTWALMPALLRGAPSRVVNVSSVGHAVFAPPGGVFWPDFGGCSAAERGANPWSRYGASKLANVLHASELHRRHGARDGVVGVSLHPGNILATRLSRHFSLGVVLTMLSYPSSLLLTLKDPLKTVAAGAATSAFCAVGPLEGSAEAEAAAARGVGCFVRGGGYHQDCAVATARVNPLGGDAALAARLWDETERVIGAAA